MTLKRLNGGIIATVFTLLAYRIFVLRQLGLLEDPMDIVDLLIGATAGLVILVLGVSLVWVSVRGLRNLIHRRKER